MNVATICTNCVSGFHKLQNMNVHHVFGRQYKQVYNMTTRLQTILKAVISTSHNEEL